MGKIICIDAGHGGTDPGASGNSVVEKNVTLKTALTLGDMLKKQGFNVIFTRVADNFISLGERCRIANNNLADLFISVHVNSAGNAEARGTETLCYSKSKFTEIVQKRLISELNTKDRGIKERKDLYVLNGTKMNAVLVELAFLSNIEDAALLKKDLFLDKAAKAITKSVCEYFNVSFNDNDNDNDNNGAKKIKIIVNGVEREVYTILRNDFNYIRLRDLENAGAINLDYKNGVVYVNSKTK